jgi:hypothetical protein
MDAVCDRLERMPEVKVTRRLKPSEKLQSAGTYPSCPEIAVVEAAALSLAPGVQLAPALSPYAPTMAG